MVEEVIPIVPLNFAPTVDWWAKFVNYPKLILADEAPFPKQTNRNRIVYGTFQGAKIFTIPVIHASLTKNYKGVEISYAVKWQNQLINALRTSYGKSPFFEYYGYRFESIILYKYKYLWDLNLAILEEVIKCLKIELVLDVKESKEISEKVTSSNYQYYQVFQEKISFMPNLTVFDLIFNEGPDALSILQEMNQNLKIE